MQITHTVTLEPTGENLYDFIDSLIKIRDSVAGNDPIVRMDSYELAVQWTETV